MASNKNQHFVPRCYLKPFTLNGDGLAINVFNIDRSRLIENASVKHQCSGNYFYGEDLALEKGLQELEGEYALVLSEILRSDYRLTDIHRSLLRRFWLLQYLRTEAASRRTVEMSTEMEKVVGSPADAFRTTIREAVQMAMRVFLHALATVDDLKVCLIHNRTNVPFVTSDDPAILTNRWHLKDQRAKGMAPGLSSAGALLFLPLSPRVLCVGYDSDVYSISHTNGWIDAKRERDIYAFNQHQFLNCRANIYFRTWQDRQRLQDDFNTVVALRPGARHRIHYAVFDRAEDGKEVFRVIDRAEIDQHKRAMIHTEAVFAQPSIWPLQIAWRNRGAVYMNGTGVGYIRRDVINIIGGDGYRKIRA